MKYKVCFWYTVLFFFLFYGLYAIVPKDNDKIILRTVMAPGAIIEKMPVNEKLIIADINAVINNGSDIFKDHKEEYKRPVKGGRITSGFAMRWGRMHNGIDIGVPVGTEVFAAKKGTIKRAEEIGTYGLCVIISHGDGSETRYAHLSKFFVEVGDKVEQGELIALSGNTGRTTGPHIHFEVRVEGEPCDPCKYLTESTYK